MPDVLGHDGTGLGVRFDETLEELLRCCVVTAVGPEGDADRVVEGAVIARRLWIVTFVLPSGLRSIQPLAFSLIRQFWFSASRRSLLSCFLSNATIDLRASVRGHWQG